ncbi:epoxide hydrolase N-terminal domain-containing protein [Bullifex porci]|uniref:epoxide hydrolase N-terminal domain-containing protein n=1 Tax=Bullifex porci TaxID=2606638 RepID=UPI003C6C5089
MQHSIDSTRFPKPFMREDWDLGVDDGYLSSLLDYWRYDYDWSRKEAELNRYPQFTCHGTKKRYGFLYIYGFPSHFLTSTIYSF